MNPVPRIAAIASHFSAGNGAVIRNSSCLNDSRAARFLRSHTLALHDVRRMAQRGGTVLVVDDEAPVLEVLRGFLTKAGYDVLAASNGAAGLELVHAGPSPDLIVLDLMMPVMTGFEVL